MAPVRVALLQGAVRLWRVYFIGGVSNDRWRRFEDVRAGSARAAGRLFKGLPYIVDGVEKL